MKPAKQPLTAEESARLDLGRRSTREIAEMKQALRQAHSSKAYKKDGLTFVQYVTQHYGISSSYAYMLINDRIPTQYGVSASLRWTVWERDNFTCLYCGKRRFLSVDHIIPISRGGTDALENVVTSCARCNRCKGVKDYETFQTPILKALRLFKRITEVA